MDIRKVKKLIELLEESGIAEIEISEGEESVRISRYPQGMTVSHGVPMQAVATSAPSAAPRAEAPAGPPPANPAPTADKSITAPMVGTFYASPAPGAKPFVQVGDEIKVGQVLCIIEAMKMMNQIESEKEGRVVSVLARNGEPVEFGQPLFVIE
ncbi:MAG: acetyl-CoA carboxylase [Proteobacteria bacterium]|nr:acetyl-CoA carboxylase [Pseudomonadota bacterium]